jgi:hypothetical protein
MCQSDGLRWSNTVGFIPHGCKQCSDAVWALRQGDYAAAERVIVALEGLGQP